MPCSTWWRTEKARSPSPARMSKRARRSTRSNPAVHSIRRHVRALGSQKTTARSRSAW